MIGRGAYGAPWMPGRIATALATGVDPGAPDSDVQRRIAKEHVAAMLDHYGAFVGLRNARKHIGWYLATSGLPDDEVKRWRAQLCTDENAASVLSGLENAYADAAENRRLAA